MKRFFIAFLGAGIIMCLFMFLFYITNSIPLLVLGIIAFILFILWAMKYIAGGIAPEDIPNGMPATATVASVRQGNFKIKLGVAEYYALVIDAEIVNQQGERWQAKIKQTVPVTQVGVFQPGVSFAVKYDPNNRNKVVVEQNSGDGDQKVGASGFSPNEIQSAMQAAPKDITARLKADSLLLNKLKVTGRSSQAAVIDNSVIYKNYLPNSNVYLIRFLVNDTGIEGDQMIIMKAENDYKIQPGKPVYVRYDINNQKRVAMTGTDKPDTSVVI